MTLFQVSTDIYPVSWFSFWIQKFSVFILALPMEEIGANFVWLKPIVETFNDKVPGALILTDVWLYLDRLLGEKLLVKPNETKANQAGKEADRCKKLVGALRYLYRNSSLAHGLSCSFQTEPPIYMSFLPPEKVVLLSDNPN